MYERRWMALAVALSGLSTACQTVPDRDHLDRSGRYHEEVVDEGSYAVYQHSGAIWKKVGFVWVGPEAEHTVWVLRRPASGGYPYRPPSSTTKEIWTRFKRIGREDSSVEALVAAEKLEPARYYAIDSHQLVHDCPTASTSSEGVAPSPAAATSYRLMLGGRPIGYMWSHGEHEVFLLEREALRAIKASASTNEAEPKSLVPVRIDDGPADWKALVDAEDLARGRYEIFACHCREHTAAELR